MKQFILWGKCPFRKYEGIDAIIAMLGHMVGRLNFTLWPTV
jgi:hypothetical protein